MLTSWLHVLIQKLGDKRQTFSLNSKTVDSIFSYQSDAFATAAGEEYS